MGACETLELSDWGTVLGTRELGREVRNRVVHEMDLCPQVTISFSRVEIVSSSFADEAIARLLDELGPDRFRVAVRLVGASPAVRSVVTSSLSRRDSMRLSA